MSTESHEPEAALVELRKRLDDGLAGTGLTKTMIARRAELSRATVQAAFRPGGAAPSAATVSALARALGLPDAELLHLRRAAVAHPGGPAPVRGSDPGRPIAAWDPLDLEVHPADTAGTRRVLPGYVSRRHDQVLADAVREAADGRSRMLVLVGSSSTGKTRACWEAVQPLAAGGWLLWHPYDPTRAEAALAGLPCVGPRTVVWLNETQHYLGDPQHGERVAAALHSLLTDSARGPVLVLGTLWPEFADRFADLPGSRRLPAHSRVRELMAGRTLGVPDTFDREALRTAAALAAAGDRALAAALTRSRTDGRVTQDLAGAPELLRRYEHGTPAVRALVAAAMDARRLGVGPLLSPAFLADAASDYLTDHDHGRLDDDWAEAALADLARPVHGRQAPWSPSGRAPRSGPRACPSRRRCSARARSRFSASPTSSNSTAVRRVAGCARPRRSGTPPTRTSCTRTTSPLSPPRPRTGTVCSGPTTSASVPPMPVIRVPWSDWRAGGSRMGTTTAPRPSTCGPPISVTSARWPSCCGGGRTPETVRVSTACAARRPTPVTPTCWRISQPCGRRPGTRNVPKPCTGRPPSAAPIRRFLRSWHTCTARTPAGSSKHLIADSRPIGSLQTADSPRAVACTPRPP
ncbi:hypothetical protein GCM10025734_82660 [Kitasatospora paranensis]|uniref:helix-turn-helix domain-containing protein n=1 Tax=Kitasatospora paranensis TaxID=258053 RepID=UPI0031E730F0